MALKKLDSCGKLSSGEEVSNVEAMPIFLEQASVTNHNLSLGVGIFMGQQFLRWSCESLKALSVDGVQFTMSELCFPEVSESRGARY